MSGKYLIFGATGSIGSNLAKLMVGRNHDVQLIGRDENGLNALSSELNCKYSVVDVLDEQSVKNLKNEFEGQEIAGIAYCVGSIDLKPVRAVKKDDTPSAGERSSGSSSPRRSRPDEAATSRNSRSKRSPTSTQLCLI